MSRRVAAAILTVLSVCWVGACRPTDGGARPASLDDPAYRAAAQRARDASRAGRPDEAIREATVALDHAPEAREPYADLSRLFLQIGRDAEAVSFFRSAAARHADVAWPWFYRGFHEFRLHHWTSAGSAFEQAVAREPDDAESHFRLATVRQTLGDFDAALEHFGIAQELDGDNPGYAAALARALRIGGRYDEAEQVIETALERSPSAGPLHYARAQLAIREGRDDDAEASLRRALELDPGSEKAHDDLAGLLLRGGRKAEGRAHEARATRLRDYARFKAFLQTRLGLFPRHPRVPLLMAELELTGTDPRPALGWLNRSQALGGPGPRIAADRAGLFFALGERERGEAELERLSGAPDAATLLARSAERLLDRDTDGAVRLLERALARGPDDKIFLTRVSDLYGHAGKSAEAIEMLIRANTADYPPAPTEPWSGS